MKNIQQLDLFSEQPEQPEQPTPAPATDAPQFSATEIEAMKAKLLAWGQQHHYPAFSFPFSFPPRDEDKDRRFGILWRGRAGWKQKLAQHGQYERYPGEWLARALEHVERYDCGIWRIPEQISSIADDRE
jgi:hypothetical protein